MIVWKLSNIYSFLNECDSAIRLLEEDLENQQLYYKDHYEAKRPFYNLAAGELQIYASLFDKCYHGSSREDGLLLAANSKTEQGADKSVRPVQLFPINGQLLLELKASPQLRESINCQ